MRISGQTVFLVVDDFETMRKITVAQLRVLGAGNILTANNGAEALRILQHQHVDMVLADWNMPVMSGLALLQSLRCDPQRYSLPFIMITAEAGRERVAEAIACGVSDLLVKPYTAERLSARIDRAMAWKPQQLSAAVLASRSHAALLNIRGVAGSEAPTSKVTRRPSILMVDDAPDNLHLLSHLFKDDYLVRVANSGEKALNFCRSDDPPDLVLLDILMPDMDGFEVASRMREHPNAQNIPIIFVTAMTDEDARLKGLQLGAVDFVTKPINPDILKPRVRNFMRYVELRKQLQADYDSMLDAARLREDVELITRHDMKGPLAGMIGLVQALAEDSTMSRSDLTKQLRVVEETALQVLNLINLSSELYKIETGRFQLNAQPVKIIDILRRIVEISRTTFASKALVFAGNTELPADPNTPMALGDAMLCYSLFQNLLKNACEAAPVASTISVILLDQSPLSIVIENRGVVPAEIRERFFDKFVTLNTPGGTGLGTYSAKLLSEAQGGKITLAVNDETNTTSVVVELSRASSVQIADNGSTPKQAAKPPHPHH